jgi:hypothetical protein
MLETGAPFLGAPLLSCFGGNTCSQGFAIVYNEAKFSADHA